MMLTKMEKPIISLATDEEREWTAELLAGTEPWITLGVTIDKCLKSCTDPDYLLYVAHLGGKPCGSIILHKRGVAGSPYIKSIAVSGEFRSHGIGAKLIEFTENLFRNEAKHLFLCVSSFNSRARSFYERLGFEAVGEFKDYIVEGKSEILMHKRLI
jgi:ribosomal protein S18 acetylase RimI-like enzyme